MPKDNPIASASQGRLMGMVHACQKYGKCASDKVKDIAAHIKPADADEMGSAKRKNLPDKVKKKTFKEFLEEKNYEII